MARKAKAKSKVALAAEAARKALADAKERNAKNSTPTTVAAVSHAATILKDAVAKENRERFLTIGGGRVAKTLAVLETLKQVANRKSYDYSAADIEKATSAINHKVGEIEAAFAAALATPVAADRKTATVKAFEF
jgi:hypothetical protein